MAKRVQRQRTKGWRMPEGAIYVGRPSKWGNPYRAVAKPDGTWMPTDDNGVMYDGYGPFRSRDAALADCVRLFEELEIGYHLLSDRGAVVAELAGRDLACWCPLDQPCHADVLLEFANEVTDRD